MLFAVATGVVIGQSNFENWLSDCMPLITEFLGDGTLFTTQSARIDGTLCLSEMSKRHVNRMRMINHRHKYSFSRAGNLSPIELPSVGMTTA